MAVFDQLDYTPAFTMSTIQTNSEIANIIIVALLVVLILSNIGSAVSKAIFFTRDNSFNYKSWVRAFIFTNSDDPLRIIAWIMRRYVYRDPGWQRFTNKLRLKRLILPLLARFVILLGSIVSIVITIPRDKILQGCDRGDYRIQFDFSKANPTIDTKPICSDIPLHSNLGVPRASASYCICPVSKSDESTNTDSFGDNVSAIGVSFNPAAETLLYIILHQGTVGASVFYIEWKRPDKKNKTFRSRIPESTNAEKLSKTAFIWLQKDNPDCSKTNDKKLDEHFFGVYFACDGDADFDVESSLRRIESRLITSIVWEPITVKQPRLVMEDFLPPGSSGEPDFFSECIAPVTVFRPIVNMVPLAIMLVVWIAINATISFIVSRHDNALDAGFHLIKEALGHDTTSNPIEECTEREEVNDLNLRKWQCGGRGAHVGFIGRRGDVPVEEFDDSTIVCGCAIVGTELERARALHTAPEGFAPLGESTVHH